MSTTVWCASICLEGAQQGKGLGKTSAMWRTRRKSREGATDQQKKGERRKFPQRGNSLSPVQRKASHLAPPHLRKEGQVGQRENGRDGEGEPAYLYLCLGEAGAGQGHLPPSHPQVL